MSQQPFGYLLGAQAGRLDHRAGDAVAPAGCSSVPAGARRGERGQAATAVLRLPQLPLGRPARAGRRPPVESRPRRPDTGRGGLGGRHRLVRLHRRSAAAGPAGIPRHRSGRTAPAPVARRRGGRAAAGVRHPGRVGAASGRGGEPAPPDVARRDAFPDRAPVRHRGRGGRRGRDGRRVVRRDRPCARGRGSLRIAGRGDRHAFGPFRGRPGRCGRARRSPPPRSCSPRVWTPRVQLGGLRFTALDFAAAAAAVVVAVAFARGATDTGSLAGGQGTGAVLLLLPGLVVFIAAVLAARAVGFVSKLLERAGRRGALPLRLAALSLARNPGRAAVAVSFLVVSLGLALFAAVYRSTLTQGQRDQAAYAVPAAAVVSEDNTKLVRVLQAAPFGAYQRIGKAAQVIRLSGNVAGGANFTLLAMPSTALAGVGGWRSNFSPLSRPQLAGRIAPAGPVGLRAVPLPPGRLTLPLSAERPRPRPRSDRDGRRRFPIRAAAGPPAGRAAARLLVRRHRPRSRARGGHGRGRTPARKRHADPASAAGRRQAAARSTTARGRDAASAPLPAGARRA